jgi:hypothetical protein
VCTGGRGKHNFLSGGAFCEAKYKFRWRSKRGRAKIHSSQLPSFLPALAFSLAREACHQFRSLPRFSRPNQSAKFLKV